MNEADLRVVRASLDDYASRSARERDHVNPRWFVNHAKNLLDEVDRLRAAIRQHHHDVLNASDEADRIAAERRLWAAIGSVR